MQQIVYFLKKLLPFIMTLILWRLSVYFWNPAGILALIPIFYYTFVRHIHGFTLFGLIFCFLIDYRCNLPLFWSILFCLFYAVCGFQNYIEKIGRSLIQAIFPDEYDRDFKHLSYTKFV